MKLADIARNTDKLREAILRSMRLYFGRQADQLCSQLASGAFKLPGKSLISRYRFPLDVAYMRVVSSFFCKLLKDADAGNDFAMFFC